MRKSSKKNRPYYDNKAASSELYDSINKTVGPESSLESTSINSTDTTSTAYPDEEQKTQSDQITGWHLLDKYLLSGKYDLPIFQISFILLIGASIWIFITDNANGTFGLKGDWWSLLWTIQKCFLLWAFIVLWLLLYYFYKRIQKKIDSNKVALLSLL